MIELRLELAEKCCPACDVPALVHVARRLELLEEPGNGGVVFNAALNALPASQAITYEMAIAAMDVEAAEGTDPS